MQTRKKYIENAVVSTTAFSFDTTSDIFYAFEQTSWGYTLCFPKSNGIPNYDILVSYDKGQNWFKALSNLENPFSVLAPRIKLIARGDDSNSTSIDIIQRELPPAESARDFVFTSEKNITNSTKEFSLPSKIIGIIMVESEEDLSIMLQTSFNSIEWFDASEEIILEKETYQEINFEPKFVGNYFRIKASKNILNEKFLLGLLVQE